MSKLEVSTMLESFLEIYNYIEIYFVIYNLLVNFKKKKEKNVKKSNRHLNASNVRIHSSPI